jgi:hypothetical protein
VQPGRNADPEERFSLAPLPTSAIPPDEQLLGVSERLLASPVPEMEIGESPALEVLGPLEAPAAPQNEGASEKSEGLAAPAAVGRVVADTAADSSPSDAGMAMVQRPEPFGDSRKTTTGETSPRSEKRSRHTVPFQAREREASRGTARLVVFVDGETSWREFEPRTRCGHGRFILRVRIDGGIVREVWPVGGVTSEQRTQLACAGDLIRGLPIADVVDGEYAAEVVVEPHGEPTD